MANFDQKNKLGWIIFISALIVVISILHYTTSTSLNYLHELYRAFYYIPIIFAAFRFQLKGGILSALIIIIFYYPHVAFQWGGTFLHNFSRFLEMVMYFIIGSVTGVLSMRQFHERQRYQKTATELKSSYQQLKIQSEKITEIDEQLRQSEKLSILGELSASLAHEVRNPLGSIWGVVEILQDKFKDNNENSEFLEILVNEVKRLNKVVESFLTLARKKKTTKEEINLYELIQSVIFQMNNKAKKHKVSLETDFPDKTIKIKLDANQLRQILINLILNSIAAISYTGLIIIKVEVKQDPDSNRLFHEYLHLSVIDTGKGISQENLNTIYKPFYTTKKDGTGLGLSIVKRIVDQNKWSMNITSTAGKGTTVTLIFPTENLNG